jgi:N-acetylglucosaminyl-diphospho-decaprenol L-rhamnosyltransferase
LNPDLSVPDVSVILVSWNTRELLLQCLESIAEDAARCERSVEMLVIDNASADGTVEAVRERFPNVLISSQSQNLGFAAATNIGIEQSRAPAVLILNPDTELKPGALGELLRALDAAAHIGMTAPALLNPDQSFQTAGFKFPGLVQTMLDLYPIHPRLIESRLNGRYGPGDGTSPFKIDHPLGACMLVRRAVIEKVGMLDTSFFLYSEEIDWCRRITEAGWTILCAPAAKVIHHGGQSTGQTPDRMRTQLHQSRARYFRTHESPGFNRRLQMLMRLGVTLKRWGLPVPSDGRSADELESIARIYATVNPERIDE